MIPMRFQNPTVSPDSVPLATGSSKLESAAVDGARLAARPRLQRDGGEHDNEYGCESPRHDVLPCWLERLGGLLIALKLGRHFAAPHPSGDQPSLQYRWPSPVDARSVTVFTHALLTRVNVTC